MSGLDVAESGELHALRRALGDMAALSSLPAFWVHADETRIAESLADALLRVLDLDGVRVIHARGEDQTQEVTRLHPTGNTSIAILRALLSRAWSGHRRWGARQCYAGFFLCYRNNRYASARSRFAPEKLPHSGRTVGSYYGGKPSGGLLAKGA